MKVFVTPDSGQRTADSGQRTADTLKFTNHHLPITKSLHFKGQKKPVFLKIVKVITEISDRYFLGIFR